MSDPSPGRKRGVLVGLGVIAIILSSWNVRSMVFIHPGMTVTTIIYVLCIILIIVGIEKIISGIFVKHRQRTKYTNFHLDRKWYFPTLIYFLALV
jgi:uncharacterized membrane protein HdeD (DUF308 family)